MVLFDDSIVSKDFSSKTEWNYFMEREYNIKKRAEVLGIITKDTFVLLSGTHGKTTTSSILGHILYESGADVIIGGIVENYNSNLVGDGKQLL
jgi:UDP-N-acetylmuramate--alanine ligase